MTDLCVTVVYPDEKPAGPKRSASEPPVERSQAPLVSAPAAVAPEVTKPLEDKTVKPGKMVKIGFELKPGSPDPKIEWFKDGSAISGDGKIY